MTHLNRRQVVQWTGASVLAFFFITKMRYSPFSFISKYSEVKDPLLHPDFLDFHATSATVLGVPPTSLDISLAHQYWTTLTSDSTTHRHLLLLSKELKNKQRVGTPIKNIQDLPETVHLVTQRLLKLWYTGVNTLASLPAKRMTYQGALMFSLFQSFRSAPGTCGGSFGFWMASPTSSLGDIQK